MFDLTRNMVDNGSVALSDNLLGQEANRGVDGRYYSQFGIGQSIFDIPFYAAGRVAERIIGRRVAKPDSIEKAVVCASRTLAAAGAVTALFQLALAVLRSPRAALFSAALAGVGSLLWPYSKFGFNTALTAWIATAMALLLWRGVDEGRHRLLAWAGILGGLGWLTRHEFPVVILAFAVWLGVFAPGDRRSARLVAFLPGALTGGLLWMAYNFARFGRLLFVGYQPAYSGAGFAGLLFSPGESVLVYWPAVVLCLVGLVPLMRMRRHAVTLAVVPTLAMFSYAGMLVDWAGGRSYGPRYLVPFLPLLALGAGALFVRASRRGRAALMAALIAAACLQLPGVLVDYSRVGQAWAGTASQADITGRLFIWRASPIVLNSVASVSGLSSNVSYLTGRQPIPSVDRHPSTDDRGFAAQFGFSLDFWWLYLYYLGVLPRWAALTAGLSLWMAAAALAGRASRLAARAGTHERAATPGA